jgi:osmotically-inducible protein OsmY
MESTQRIRVDYPDHDVCARVKSFLFSRHLPGIRELEVEVNHGTVTLSGTVNSYYEKQVALNSCQRVAGVLKMVDRMEVHPDSSRPVTPR